MKLIKHIYLCLAVLLVATLTGCSDNMPAESYYTFTGEMMSDYLKGHDDFSEFAEIVTRAKDSERGVNLMDLISCYGQYTCFAPTNEAVDQFLKQNGYKSVADIPVNICDTIARTHFVSGVILNTVDLIGTTSLSKVNMNDRYLSVAESYITDEQGDTVNTTLRLNRSGDIILSLANDSVENGIVQPVNAVLSSSNLTLFDLMKENPRIELFTNAMEVTGIGEFIRNKIKDAKWEELKDKYEPVSVYSGGQWDYCRVPEHKKYGFTAFACPDTVLREKYNIQDLQTFYDYARNIYGGEELDVTDPANADKLRAKNSPLRRLIGYNCLNVLGVYDMLTTICSIERTVINPTEWYSTLDSLSTIKCERLTVSRFIGKGDNGKDDHRNELYLNRGDMSRGMMTSGIHVEPLNNDEPYEHSALNGYYYYTNGLADFGETTKQNIFNTRVRMDLYTFFPELANNSVRDGRTTNSINDSNNPDISKASPNYWFPKGFLDNVKVNDDAIFLFQSQHNTYWSYEGDEFNLSSKVGSYDITFNLPTVPTGTYQIRLGFCAMATRGIAQFYLDDVPRGIPFDMRNDNFVARTGWFALNTKSGDELEAAKKNMHNLGWYHGPKGVFNAVGEGVKDEYVTNKNYFCNNGGGGYTVRFVMATATLDERKQHTIRIKSVWAENDALAMIDYIELVPKSVYGVEGEGRAEDDY